MLPVFLNRPTSIQSQKLRSLLFSVNTHIHIHMLYFPFQLRDTRQSSRCLIMHCTRVCDSSLRNFYLLLAISLIPFSTSNTISTLADWSNQGIVVARDAFRAKVRRLVSERVNVCTSWKISRIVNVLVLCLLFRVDQFESLKRKKSEVSFSEDPQFYLILQDMSPVRRNSYSQEHYPLTNFVRCLAYLWVYVNQLVSRRILHDCSSVMITRTLRTSTRTEIVVITKITLRFRTIVSNPKLFRLFASPTRLTFVICRSLIYYYWRSVSVNRSYGEILVRFWNTIKKLNFLLSIEIEWLFWLEMTLLGDWVNLDWIILLFLIIKYDFV